ncbi:hypothetical protein BDN72DRAFT_842682 [Pluteus cervinus]|uniref:Uncharacterized protein n=1 Tax=Pluteus cervinus TaxID=181527 RepID=A0ACD3APV6_9AGAR|nr:hypothetical protein BDN72DRAFT_842682 [Pluteus cervinus]
MRPTEFRPNTAPSAGGPGRFFPGGKHNNNNVFVGVAALAALTGLVYWFGYNGVDKRHRNDHLKKKD